MTATATVTPIEYISVTDTAKLIRQALKAAFPGEKFSVRSQKYSGGASIRVTYSSPSLPVKEVNKVARKFSGATFDGMTDMMSYHTSELDGRQVYYCANFVFVSNKDRSTW